MQTNVQAQAKRADLEAYGLTGDSDQYRVNIKEYTSTNWMAVSTVLGDLNFFAPGQALNSYNTHTFPRNETACEILGIKLTHNLQLFATDVLATSKQNQMYELFSRINLKYGQVEERISLSVATLMGIKSPVVNSGEQVTTQFSGAIANDGFWRFPKGMNMKIGAKQDAFWTLKAPPGALTLAAADTAGINANLIAPVVPGYTTGVFFVNLTLLVKEFSDAKS